LPVAGDFTFAAGDPLGLTFNDDFVITAVESPQMRRKFLAGDTLIQVNGLEVSESSLSVADLIAQAVERNSGQLTITALRKRGTKGGTL